MFLPTDGDNSTLLLFFAERVGQRGVNRVKIERIRIKDALWPTRDEQFSKINKHVVMIFFKRIV